MTITNVPIGLTIELRFNGQVVDTKTASSPFTAGAAAAPGFADVPMSFLVPALAPGSYTLEAVGPAFRCECLPGTGFAVLSSGATKPEGGSGTSAGGLARTGVTVAFFVAVALGLVVGGRALLEASRQTRRRAVPRGRHLRDPELEGSDR